MKIKDNISSEFDQFSTEYTEDMIRCVPHYLTLLNEMIKALPKSFQARKILDLGCGNGNVANLLLRLFPDAQYDMVDASPEMLKICRERFTKISAEYYPLYFQDFNFLPSTYDLITASFSFHHLESSRKEWIFGECYKALRPGGILTSCDLMISKSNDDHPQLLCEWEQFVLSNYDDTSKWEWLMEHYAVFDKPDDWFSQIKWLDESGFSDTRVPWRQGYWAVLQSTK